MNAYLKNHSAEIDSIAINLTDHFAKPLYHFTDAKSYSEYIEILKEILSWSIEFYVQYHHKLNSWESYARSQDNIYKSVEIQLPSYSPFAVEPIIVFLRSRFVKINISAGILPAWYASCI
jgi:hypothetical protein